MSNFERRRGQRDQDNDERYSDRSYGRRYHRRDYGRDYDYDRGYDYDRYYEDRYGRPNYDRDYDYDRRYTSEYERGYGRSGPRQKPPLRYQEGQGIASQSSFTENSELIELMCEQLADLNRDLAALTNQIKANLDRLEEMNSSTRN